MPAPDRAMRPDRRAGGAAARPSAEVYRSLSLWHDTAPDPLEPRAPLAGDVDVDVAIVGAGYTGLWTAYYLARADPSLRIAVLERDIAGFGASGRNGGWCSAYFPASSAKLARMAGRTAAVAMRKAMQGTVAEVGRVVAAEGIDCHWSKGGTVLLARTPLQLRRAQEEVAEARSFGDGEQDLRLVSAGEARELLAATGVLGGTWTPHCAAIHPLRLARGLARVVEQAGVRIFERTPVRSIAARTARTPHATVHAEHVVRAVEGYTPSLSGLQRAIAPLYSLMIATEPLPDGLWREIGLGGRATFGDYRHLIIYGQRTADGRLAFGGRGAPYHFGSRISSRFDRDPRTLAALRRALAELLPVLGEVPVTHHWGGPLGVPRDWCASVGLDRATGIGWAGGYVGDGVGTSNLAGRTLADLILGHDSELVRLPWTGHRSPSWEPEPLRWLGVNTALRAMGRADRTEARTGRPSRSARALGRLIGR